MTLVLHKTRKIAWPYKTEAWIATLDSLLDILPDILAWINYPKVEIFLLGIIRNQSVTIMKQFNYT